MAGSRRRSAQIRRLKPVIHRHSRTGIASASGRSGCGRDEPKRSSSWRAVNQSSKAAQQEKFSSWSPGSGLWPGPAKLRFRFVAGNLPFVGAPWQEFRVRREGRLVAGTGQSGAQVGRPKPVIQGGPGGEILSRSPAGFGRVEPECGSDSSPETCHSEPHGSAIFERFGYGRSWPTGGGPLSQMLAPNRPVRSVLERQQSGVDFVYRSTRHRPQPVVRAAEGSHRHRPVCEVLRT